MSTFRYLLFFGLSAFLLNCRTSPDTDNSIIHIRLKKDPERLHPLVFPTPTAREVYQYIHVPLAELDPATQDLIPVLAVDIPEEQSIDTGALAGGVYFDIEIDADATWDNGSPVTAADYIFSLKSIMLPLTGAGNYRDLVQHISDVQQNNQNDKKCRVFFAKDNILAREIAMTLEVYPQYVYDSLHILDKYSYSQIANNDEKWAGTDSLLVQFADQFNGVTFSRNKVSGAGPYKLVSWTTDQEIVLERKKNYWGSPKNKASLEQHPATMVFHVLPDELAAITQLKAGTIDVVNEISAEYYKELESDSVISSRFHFFHPALMKQYYIALNNTDPILSDVLVRKALAHLVETDNIIQTIEMGMGIRSYSPVHPLKQTYDASLQPISYDPAKASALLAQAGWKDLNNDGLLEKTINNKLLPLQLDILISGQALGKKIALLLQESAAKAGMRISITEKDFKLIRTENLKTRKYQLIPSVQSQDIVKWDDLSKWTSENDQPEGNNDVSYRNALVDSLVSSILNVKNEKQRINLYKTIQQQIYQDQPVIFLYAPEERLIISKKWKATSSARRPGYQANTFVLAES
jgi:peptide/nickel transport system substrate-binding protein